MYIWYSSIKLCADNLNAVFSSIGIFISLQKEKIDRNKILLTYIRVSSICVLLSGDRLNISSTKSEEKNFKIIFCWRWNIYNSLQKKRRILTYIYVVSLSEAYLYILPFQFHIGLVIIVADFDIGFLLIYTYVRKRLKFLAFCNWIPLCNVYVHSYSWYICYFVLRVHLFYLLKNMYKSYIFYMVMIINRSVTFAFFSHYIHPHISGTGTTHEIT